MELKKQKKLEESKEYRLELERKEREKEREKENQDQQNNLNYFDDENFDVLSRLSDPLNPKTKIVNNDIPKNKQTNINIADYSPKKIPINYKTKLTDDSDYDDRL